MMVQSVNLRKMNENEYMQFREYSITDYAESLIKSGKCTEKDARMQAETDFLDMMTGLSDEDNHLCIAENTDNIPVGMLWYETEDPAHAFIADFLVYDNYRQMGYGSAMIVELENILKSGNVLSIRLHVFEYNIAAIKLYEKCGFAIVKSDNGSIYMEKKIYHS